MTDEPDTTEKVEQTETGYRLTVKSKRGTGTRDEDTVSVTAKTETLEELEQQAPRLEAVVKAEMDNRRAHRTESEE